MQTKRIMRIFDYEFLSKNPPYAAILSAFFVFLGMISAYFFFSSAMSLVMVSFSSLLLLPYVTRILKTDKIKGSYRFSGILKRYDKLIGFYIYLFFGMSLAYMFLYIILAPAINERAFSSQVSLIIPGPVGFYFNPDIFTQIIANNLTIVFVCVLLSLFYGTGSIFILNYNASVLGVMYGSAVRPLVWGAGSVPIVFANMLAYVPHTLLEVLAYLLAAISGGILSNALIMNSGSGDSKKIVLLIKDCIFFLMLSVILILAGGVIETVIPPLFS